MWCWILASAEAQREAWTWWAMRHGIDPAPVLATDGVTALAKIQHHMPDLTDDQALYEAVLMARYEERQVGTVRAYPGAAELLRRPSAAIVTSATLGLAVKRLEAAGLTIPRVLVTAEVGERGKPDPEPYLRAATLLSCLPRDCDVIEDSVLGVAAGVAAGM